MCYIVCRKIELLWQLHTIYNVLVHTQPAQLLSCASMSMIPISAITLRRYAPSGIVHTYLAMHSTYVGFSICNIVAFSCRSLIDQDKDGRINKAEFCAGVHLISFARQGGALPFVLPQYLLKESQVRY